MENISPDTQAVKRDFAQIMNELHQRCRVSISCTDTLPITLETNDVALQAGINSLCAAAICAAADQVVPEQKPWHRTTDVPATRHLVRTELLAIANQLKNI